MTYRPNGGYGSGASYSFSSRVTDHVPSNNVQMGYTNNFDVSYSGGGYGKTPNGFDYESRGSKRTDYNTKGGNSLLGTMGDRSGKGIVGGRGMGRGKGMGNKGQGCFDMQNQFTVKQENNDSLTDIDLAIKKLDLPDSSQNHIITKELTQLEVVFHKTTTFVKKEESKQEHLELIIRKVESLSKKYRKNC